MMRLGPFSFLNSSIEIGEVGGSWVLSLSQKWEEIIRTRQVLLGRNVSLEKVDLLILPSKVRHVENKVGAIKNT